MINYYQYAYTYTYDPQRIRTTPRGVQSMRACLDEAHARRAQILPALQKPVLEQSEGAAS